MFYNRSIKSPFLYQIRAFFLYRKVEEMVSLVGLITRRPWVRVPPLQLGSLTYWQKKLESKSCCETLPNLKHKKCYCNSKSNTLLKSWSWVRVPYRPSGRLAQLVRARSKKHTSDKITNSNSKILGL